MHMETLSKNEDMALIQWLFWHILELHGDEKKELCYHIESVTMLSYFVMKHVTNFSIEEKRLFPIAAMLCDWGKLGVSPDDILNAHRKLSSEEVEKIQKHWDVFGPYLKVYPELRTLVRVMADHHETIEGKGYKGLKGEKIPKLAKLLSVLDYFDALAQFRSYRDKVIPPEEVVEDIRKDALLPENERRWDKWVLEAFLEMWEVNQDYLKGYYERINKELLEFYEKNEAKEGVSGDVSQKENNCSLSPEDIKVMLNYVKCLEDMKSKLSPEDRENITKLFQDQPIRYILSGMKDFVDGQEK